MLHVVVKEQNGHVNIVLSRSLDITTIGTATEQCLPALRRRPTSLVLHLDTLQFIDSSGVRFLMALVARAEAGRCACAVVTGGNTHVHRLVRLLEVEQRLPLYLTHNSALFELAQRARTAGD